MPGLGDPTPSNPPEQLPAELYEQLRLIARARMSDERTGHTLQTTALVHEAYVKLAKDKKTNWTDRPTFFRAAARAMRQILIDHARANRAQKRGGAQPRASADLMELAADADPDEILALDDAVSRLEQQSPESAEVVRLRFYAGLSIEETAEAMGTSVRSVNRLWTFARAWLWRELNTR